jgi:hypothetical protein
MNGDATTHLAKEYARLGPQLNERERRLWAGKHAKALGRGGPTRIAKLTKLSRPTIYQGMREANEPQAQQAGHVSRVRRPGGGRKPLVTSNTLLRPALNALIEPMGAEADSALRWTTLGTKALARMLQDIGHHVEARTVAMLLEKDGYALDMNRKAGRTGTAHPDRNQQCVLIAEFVRQFEERREPAVYVELTKGQNPDQPRKRGPGKQSSAMPSAAGTARPPLDGKWTAKGIARDMAGFCAAAVERWWRELGQKRFPRAKRLLIAADSGGDDAQRAEAWKVVLQQLVDELRMEVFAAHIPPITAKWRVVEDASLTLVWSPRQHVPGERWRARVELVTRPQNRKQLIAGPMVVEARRRTWTGVGRTSLSRLG